MLTDTVHLPLPPAEPEHPWPSQGQWTYADFLRLPDDGRRYEIIEGVLYMANAPSYEHQYTVAKLVQRLGDFVEARGLGIVIAAPFEVHLPGIATPVQPDVLYITAARQPHIGAQTFEGAPDLVVEVLSPGSLRLDQFVKFGAYERAGVREYWLADPKARDVIVYSLPANGREYVELGQFGPGEKLKSSVLAGLEVAVDDLFAPPAA